MDHIPLLQLSLDPQQNQRIKAVDQLLPQTQCGLCDYPGCLPYAAAMVTEGVPINQCVPGGAPVVAELANLLQQTPLPPRLSRWADGPDGRPQRVKAIIREAECIGCTKCIDACPVDAIVGAAKLMHTVLADACTGCELCVLPCPVDCIDMVLDTQPVPSPAQLLAEQNALRQRFYARLQREAIAVYNPDKARKPVLAHNAFQALMPQEAVVQAAPQVGDKQLLLRQAKLRSHIKKLQATNPTSSDIAMLQQELAALNTDSHGQ